MKERAQLADQSERVQSARGSRQTANVNQQQYGPRAWDTALEARDEAARVPSIGDCKRHVRVALLCAFYNRFAIVDADAIASTSTATTLVDRVVQESRRLSNVAANLESA